MRIAQTITCVLALFCLPLASLAGEWDVLPVDPKPSELLRDFLRKQAHQALDQRLESLEKLDTKEQIAAYQKRLKSGFLQNLGEHARKTPLNVRKVGEIEGDGFTIEKLIYESRPNFFVAANFYRPHAKAPYPAVLVPCGHTSNGKAGYQKVGLILAKNGIAALIYDPVGQGERKQILKRDAEGRLLPEGEITSSTVEHSITGVAPVLLGQGLATYCIWDGIRSLDYLVSRDDVDAENIGCTGNSGGGLMTSYLMSIDDRIKAAAPGCYITTKRIKNESPGPGDAEQCVFRQISFGPDHPDFLIMRAPKPTLILSATKDFVPIEGTWIAYRQAKRIYTKLGFPERVDLVEANERHGFTEPLRVGMTRFMRRWLLGVDDAIEEGELPSFTDQQLQCTPRGQVLLLKGARSLFDLYRERADQLAAGRQGKPLGRDELVRFAGGKSDQRVVVRPIGGVAKAGYRLNRLIVHSSDGLPIPVLHFIPDNSAGKPVLLLSARGKSAEAADLDGPLHRLLKDGRSVAVPDLRGFGETATKAWRYAEKYFGRNGAEFMIIYQLGQSLVGQRANDIRAVARGLRSSQANEIGEIELIAMGAAGVPALHAAAMDTDLFSDVNLHGSIRSWNEVIDTQITTHQLENTIHGVLEIYDLPDLVRLIGPEKVRFE